MNKKLLLTGTTGAGTMAGRSTITRISVLLPLLLLLTLPVQAQAQFTYTTQNGRVTITGYTGPGGGVIIPGIIAGLPVTNIGPRAFYHDTDVTSVIIPDSVTSIGNAAFAMCWNLTSITIPDSVTSIGWQAFYHCLGLTHVTIGNGVRSIGDAAFRSCISLTAITVDEFNPAFGSLDGVLFDKSHTMLIQFPGGKAGSYTIPDGITTIGESAFYLCTRLTSVAIPDGVASIGDSAFADCTALASVALPDSITSIGGGVFGHCTSLASITIPDSVESIGGGAFAECTSLTAIIVDALNPIYRSIEGVLFDASQSTLMQFPGGKTGGYAVPGGVSRIGMAAFWNCTGVTSVIIPDSVSSIGWEAFMNCTGLTSVSIPDSVTRIEGFAFAGCTGLVEVRIGSGVTTIEWAAFSDCTGLTTVYFAGNAPELGAGGEIFGVFVNTPATIYYLPGTSGWGATFGGRPTVAIMPDSDGDGIPDAEDRYPLSDMSPTVVIGGWDSGVPNTCFADGCTISDHIAMIAASARNHGQFANGVGQYLNALKKAGVISGVEKGAIQNCAARAAIP